MCSSGKCLSVINNHLRNFGLRETVDSRNLSIVTSKLQFVVACIGNCSMKHHLTCTNICCRNQVSPLSISIVSILVFYAKGVTAAWVRLLCYNYKSLICLGNQSACLHGWAVISNFYVSISILAPVACCPSRRNVIRSKVEVQFTLFYHNTLCLYCECTKLGSSHNHVTTMIACIVFNGHSNGQCGMLSCCNFILVKCNGQTSRVITLRERHRTSTIILNIIGNRSGICSHKAKVYLYGCCSNLIGGCTFSISVDAHHRIVEVNSKSVDVINISVVCFKLQAIVSCFKITQSH